MGNPNFPTHEKMNPVGGAQRHSLARLQQWESLKYGMFIHFGMSTYDGVEMSLGRQPSSLYAPDQLDVEQWVKVARDGGMKYAILTTKHVSGHCLWPTKHSDYSVATSGNKTDVVEKFVKACDKFGVLPGFYYCSWDSHHTFGSVPTSHIPKPQGARSFTWGWAWTTQAYVEFQLKQVEELLTQYGKIHEVWIDIPGVLGCEGKIKQYEQIHTLMPDAIVMMNQGLTDGTKLDVGWTWPTDIMSLERSQPNTNKGYNPVFNLDLSIDEKPKDCYIPGEICDTVGYDWFYVDNDKPRSAEELMAMRVMGNARGVNFLLNVPPDRSGRIPTHFVEPVVKAQKLYEKLGL